MGSPAEYVAKLESDHRSATARADRLQRELSEAEERIRGLKSAAADAADTAVRAIERIQENEDLVRAAVEWREAAEAPLDYVRYRRAFRSLNQHSMAALARSRSRS